MARRKTNKRKTRRKSYKKKSRGRKSRRRKSRRRKSKRRKSRRRTRRRKRQRGGCGCGKGLFSGGSKVNVNPLNPKVQPYAQSTRDVVPRNPSQQGGRKRRRKSKRKYKGGGSLLRTIGLGDALQGYYSATDSVSNTMNRWGGKKKVVSSDPIIHRKMMKIPSSQYRIPNVPDYYDKAATKAAKHILK